MNLAQWAIKHGISAAALADLREVWGAHPTDPAAAPPGASEAWAQSQERLQASRDGGRLWRNNVGACKDERGRMVRYGLCNESKEQNKVFKSSDLIGLTPVLITPAMVGGYVGQFVAREMKAPGWRYSGTPLEVAQANFLQLVISLGGNACFSTGPIDHPVN